MTTQAVENLLASAEQARRERRLPDARRDALAAVALAEQADDSESTARAITLWARSERDLGDKEVALRAYKKAATIYRDRGDALKLAHPLRHLGDIHQEPKRLAEAEPLFREASKFTASIRKPRSSTWRMRSARWPCCNTILEISTRPIVCGRKRKGYTRR